MGMNFVCSGGSNNNYSNINPSPTNFKVKSCHFNNGYTVVNVNYPDCTNHEGNKILVFIGDKVDVIKSASVLDPHFVKGGGLVARFSPSREGLIALDKFLN